MNWETVTPEWWVPQGLRRGARRRPRQRPSRPASASRGRSPRRSTSTTRSNGRRRSRGATARSDCPAFPTSRSTSGSSPTCSRRHSRRSCRGRASPTSTATRCIHGGILNVFMTNWFTAHLLHHTHGPRLAAPAGWLADQHAVALAAPQSRQRRAARLAGAVGQDHGADVQRRQLDRLRPAPARQHRSVHARGLEAQEAAHAHRLARPSVLHRGGQARSAPLVRLLAQGHRQRHHGRAAGQAGDPQGQGRDRVARRARVAAQAHAVDQVLFRHLEGGGRQGAARSARW